MNKCNNIAGFKNYLFIASLVLFLLGTLVMTGNVFAECTNEQYSCTYTTMIEGEVVKSGEGCVDYLCIDDFEVDINSSEGGFTCYLYPATGSKYLLGTADTIGSGWGGCSVERRGRSIKIKLTLIQQGIGQEVILNCKPCDGCCGPDV
jgi:hypothetical protein